MTVALKLYQKHSQDDLLKMEAALCNDPANRAPTGSIFIYNKSTHKKLAEIASAIAMHLADKREAAGNPVPTCGYSGRQTNRR